MMISHSIRRLKTILARKPTSLCRSNSTKPIMLFVPDENQYLFDGERLSPEENLAAIPKRPEVKTTKYHKEMLSPEFIADLVINPNFNDTFITSLTRNCRFLGDETYKVIPKEEEGLPETVDLLFANMTSKYMEVFNGQIKHLVPLPPNDLMFTLSRSLESAIEQKVGNFKTTHDNDIYSLETLNELGNYLGAFRNTRQVATGEINPSLYPDLITTENFSIYLLHDQTFTDDNFNSVISFIEANLSIFTIEGLRRILETLITVMSKDSVTPYHLQVCCKFIVEQIFPNFNSLIVHLHSYMLNELATLLARDGNINESSRLITILINDRSTAASSKAVDNLLIAFDNESQKSTLKPDFLRQFSGLKSYFYHYGFTVTSARIVLKYGIDSVVELDHFLRLLLKPQNNDALVAIHGDIINTLLSIHENDQKLDQIKILELSQLLSAMIKKGLIISKPTLRTIKEYYLQLGDENNAKYIGKLL